MKVSHGFILGVLVGAGALWAYQYVQKRRTA